ncbi:plastocyanin/azurin family copper-binding protein [Pontibacter lucknowensis]|uniref:Azurin n=1 Tax=Pontibacter lucknowensis TaxID=1077936 RepID=A0A1N6WZ06_9BACT|nr:plastocyanin/azurin family copper-binding protein [Pontibacter lucknowensis]SIQ95255.1 Azurin [Pontibacter lucknowensis]
MKQIWIIGLFSVLLFASACGNQQETGDRPEKITDEPLMQQEEEQDTTLQDVEEVSIRAIGGEELESMTFDQDTIEVKAGSHVRLAFTNEGKDPKMIYNIVFTKEGYSTQVARKGSEAGASGNYLPDSTLMLAASPLALPGQTVTMEFTAPDKIGVYEFVNTYPSETPLMKGKLIIR